MKRIVMFLVAAIFALTTGAVAFAGEATPATPATPAAPTAPEGEKKPAPKKPVTAKKPRCKKGEVYSKAEKKCVPKEAKGAVKGESKGETK